MSKISQWEEAWSDYVSALDLMYADTSGADSVYWAGVAGRRLADATMRLREIDAEFCASMGI